MNRQEIMTVLPHRNSMLLLDDVVLDGEIARGEYQVRGDEWFFDGHFPDNPVTPGVILCEIVAQSACILVRQFATEDTVPYLVEVNHSRFRNLVRPGDKFETQCRLVRKRKPFYFFEGKGTVGRRLCVQMNFSVALQPK
ncbi:MAG: 3-hydroxyacyl-ACP dehydratase FabZ family protein [Planctomycetia bacterium]|nr:3-hydroxyacyl-ACP dehydratase FabZ family protein [Planctomycetia bacterium]